MPKKLKNLEIIGIFFVLAMSVFLQNLYNLSNHNLIGILFGSANRSIWESLKAIILPYIIWAILELGCLHPHMHKFAVSKIITIYFISAVYLGLCFLFSLFSNGEQPVAQLTITIVCVSLGAFLSQKLYFSVFELEKLFVPFMFLLLLFCAFYFSFTPFPPHNALFLDPETGLYGIIPQYIDRGATALDAIYFL